QTPRIGYQPQRILQRIARREHQPHPVNDIPLRQVGRQHQVAVTSTRSCAVIGINDPNADVTSCFARLETYFDHSRLDNYVIRMSDAELAVVLNSSQSISYQLQLILDLSPEVCLGLGRQEEVMRRSFMQARSALRLGCLLRPDQRVHSYDPYRHFDAMLFGLDKLGMLNEPVPTMASLQNDEGNALMDTLLTYYRLSGECTRTAQCLHIHRNTLNYRLEKISGLTGLNPRSPMDLQRLICDYVIWSRQQPLKRP
ncbi:MAG: helix-turn-helix domain-containing protein, partial [Clostridia bacterium]|nr:helix-turn-helix domain-containing protein [Clostridia bacterium]